MFPIIIPLFNIALSRAEDLILAMESRCYTPGGERSTFSVYKALAKDYLVLFIGLLFAFLLLFYPFPF
ncbi:hypothetical protein [Neobacillus niacini]|uniref:hypothetical protein n=1 Tax=Neobacillus niacini TaxID=86668 RepID=UPI00286048C6|nr:energy-coupling factor transporter transmembrane protein EcfT [Neobacillus niacini]